MGTGAGGMQFYRDSPNIILGVSLVPLVVVQIIKQVALHQKF